MEVSRFGERENRPVATELPPLRCVCVCVCVCVLRLATGGADRSRIDMASPKRSWPPDRDVDGETAAAFEAAVAVVKASVARSGEVLSSAKEDLSDHQRWLKAQAAAVESDRERLAKWLQRQRERQEAHERREHSRARRQAKRQAIIHGVRDRIAGALFAVRMGVFRSVATVAGGLNAIDAAAANGLRWIGRRVGNATLYVSATLQ